MRPNTKSFFLSIGILLLAFYFFSILTPVIWLSVGLSISKGCFIGTIVLTIMSSFLIVKTFHKSIVIPQVLYLNLVLIGILILCGSVASYFFDNTFDGQSYHFNAIISLIEGWNPVLNPNADNYQIDNWVTLHYPKASWYSAGNVIAFFENAKVGKMYNLLLIFATFFMATVAIVETTKLKTGLALFLAFIVSINIISINQICSFYLDGQISSLVIVVLSSAIFYFKLEHKWLFLSVLLASLVALVNLKFPALAYSIVFGGGFLLFDWYQNGRQHFLKLSLIFTIIFIIGFLGIGFSPYYNNIFVHGHPFYPLNELNLLDPANQPHNFNDANRFYKLFHSLFSYQGHVVGKYSTVLKSPFTQGLMNTYGMPDTRIGAFGPYFPLVLIYSLLAVIPLVLYKENRNLKIMVSLVSLIIAVSIIVHPESWWGRYIPQLFLLPFFVILLLIISQKKVLKIAGGLLLGLMFFNQINIMVSYFKNNLESTKTLNQQFEKMRQGKTTIDLCQFPALEYRLKSEGIDYQMVESEKDLPCTDFEALESCPCNAIFCIEKGEE